jgi:hypothetical protein
MAVAKPVVGFKIEEESVQAAGALHSQATKLSDGTPNPYVITIWGPANPKVRLHLDGSANPFFVGR